MTNQTSKYEEELQRAEFEHHYPTAGAMIGHIIANLSIHSLKIKQARLFATDHAQLFFTQFAQDWYQNEQTYIWQLSQSLRDEDELIPTTQSEIQTYTGLTEDASLKYQAGAEQLFDLIKDFDTQLLYITKGIALAQKESHFGEIKQLEQLYSWIKAQITQGQLFLGHSIKEGLYVESEDDDE
ncbi:DNA-binding protein [Weissella coleopterorum]|uniref:DNA-binding protein n=1 Tax=Weissella coleopterorum TaxID=2714949 RepID=A0A6G8B0K6_9LACO|nr:DNA-binding protein [Weissella coleopterorum]QIL50752.1 DNA-binding protein [Weissella coleopterorum]